MKSNLILFYIMLRLFIVLIISGWVTFGALHADRTIRVLHYGAPKDSQLKEAYLYGGGDAPIHVELNRHNFSSQIAIDQATVTLRVLPELLEEDQAFPQDAPSVDISPDWQDTLLIFFHRPDQPLMPIKIHKINASEGVFNPGEFYWINMSDVYVGGIVGGQKLRIGPWDSAVMKCPEGEIECTVKLDYLVKGETKTRGLIRQMWAVDKETRQVVFILKRPPPRYASYYVLPFRDPPKPAAAEQ